MKFAPFLILVLLFACKQNGMNTQIDGEVTTFSASTGSEVGTIQFNLSWVGSDLDREGRIEIYARGGREAPNCREGSPIYVVERVSEGATAQTLSWSSHDLLMSFRVCHMKKSGENWEVTSSSVAEGVSAKNLDFLEIFECTQGQERHGSVQCRVDYASITREIARIEIREILGSRAPHEDCASDGQIINVLPPPFYDFDFHTEPRTENPIGGPVSYRVCLFSEDNRLVHTSSSVNIIPKDAQGPDSLKAFRGATAVPAARENCEGRLDLTLELSPSFADLSHIVIRREEGSSAPKDCQSGQVEQTLYDVRDHVLSLENQGLKPQSYRACLYDKFGNLTSDNSLDTAEKIQPCIATPVSSTKSPKGIIKHSL